LAGDPKQQDQEVPHTIAFRWKSGAFNQGKAEFTAHSCCIIEDPEYGVVKIGGSGFYSVETRNGVNSGNIFDDSQPAPETPRYGDIRSVSEIEGKAYAVGLEGMAYRLEDPSTWTRIDQGLSSEFGVEAIDGFGATDIYAVGDGGESWRFNGKKWSKLEIPTNVNLFAVICAADKNVYMGGQNGILIRGKGRKWSVVDLEEMTEDIWGLEWYAGKLYLSTMEGVFWLNGDKIEPVDFGIDPPKSTYQLSAAEDVMWSIGRADVMSYDGTAWTRVV
jgi:hypothetical protein